MKISTFLPIVQWLPGYSVDTFRHDLLAGLTVAIVFVPQAMAYAMLAGLPPIYGLYAGIVPLFLYAFFGTSRQLSVGPVALVSLLILSGLSEFAEPGTMEFIQLAILTALIAGVIQVGLGVFRLGFLINFLSQPVLVGFTSAAAFIIGISQLKYLFGVNLPATNKLHIILEELVHQSHNINVLSLVIGMSAIALIFILKKIRPSIPGALIISVIGTVIVWYFGFHQSGVQIVGDVPRGLPVPVFPDIKIETVIELLPLALTVCLISFIESLAIAKTIEVKHKTYRVIPNQELIALGITKIGGAFFQSYPTTGSFTRSAINDEAGAKTGISSIITAGIISLTLLFFTPLFYFLPKTVLAAIIIVAAYNLISYKVAAHLWKTNRQDFLSFGVTFVITLFAGIQFGIFAGVILSLALILYENSKPHIAILGQIPGTINYRNIERFADVLQWDDILIVRIDGQLFFGNSNFIRLSIEDMVGEKGANLKLIILEASTIHAIDATGVYTFIEIVEYLKQKDIMMFISGATGPVRDVIHKNDLLELIPAEHHFLCIQDAVDFYQKNEIEPKDQYSKRALQTGKLKRKKKKRGTPKRIPPPE